MGNNILDVYDGGVPIQSHMRRFRKDRDAGVTTYVLIMFGMIFIMYLFGFTNMYDSYNQISLGGNGSSMQLNNTAPDEQFGFNIIDMLIRAFTENPLIYGGTALAALGLIIVGYLTKTLSTILQFLIPLIILGILNIFIFPLGSLNTHLAFVNIGGLSIASALFAFFNIIYILTVIEFVRGNA